MTIRFVKSWQGWQPGDTGAVGPGISGPYAPTEEELVERGIAEYVTTDEQSASKSDPETREALDAMAEPSASDKRDELSTLPYRDGGAGLYGLAADVAEAVGADPASQSTDDLTQFLADHWSAYKEVSDGR